MGGTFSHSKGRLIFEKSYDLYLTPSATSRVWHNFSRLSHHEAIKGVSLTWEEHFLLEKIDSI